MFGGIVEITRVNSDTHINRYTDPERIECGKAVSTKPYYPDEPGPHATFIFQYHQCGMSVFYHFVISHRDAGTAMLQAWGIIPNPNPPVASQAQDEAANDRDLELDGECENFSDEREEVRSSPLPFDAC